MYSDLRERKIFIRLLIESLLSISHTGLYTIAICRRKVYACACACTWHTVNSLCWLLQSYFYRILLLTQILQKSRRTLPRTRSAGCMSSAPFMLFVGCWPLQQFFWLRLLLHYSNLPLVGQLLPAVCLIRAKQQLKRWSYLWPVALYLTGCL